MAEGIKYLGQSLFYPIKLLNGKPIIASSKETIEQSIITLLECEKGTRFMLPEYGSRLHEVLFEPNDEVLFSMVRFFIKEAIELWEKRIKFMDVTFSQQDERIDCAIKYKILQSSEVDTLIYPFYRKINT